MIRTIPSLLLLVVILLGSCNSKPQVLNTTLSANDFANKLKQLPKAHIIDVRTPEEFSKGHLQDALNIDWQNNHFEKEISGLDKSDPILVYCLSGGRSAAAANMMRNMGFKEVYEMEGGILNWRIAGLPEVTDKPAQNQGMNRQQFDSLTASDKIVLVDFYADWCAPCKRMEPYLEEISREMSEKVTVVRINADNNTQLCKELHIDAIPVLQVYRNHKISWSHSGYIDKSEIIKQLQ